MGYQPTVGWTESFKKGTNNENSLGSNRGPSRRPLPRNPTANLPLVVGIESVDFECPECDRRFPTKIGLGQHRRRAHVNEYMASNIRVETKKTWSDEELRRLAGLEADLEGRVRFMNMELHKLHPARTLEAIKGVRKRTDYKEFVAQARIALRGVPALEVMEVPQLPDTCDLALEAALSSIELPASERLNTDSLNVVVRSVGAGDKPATLALLANYLEGVFPPRPRGSGHRRPRRSLPSTSRQRRRHEFADTQRNWDKHRSRLIRSLLDGQTEYTMPPQDRMVPYWKSVFQSDRPAQSEPTLIKSTEIDLTIHAPITSEDLKFNKLEASTSPGPDGMLVSEWNGLPVQIRTTILNLILWCRDVPRELHKASTTMIPKVQGADIISSWF